MTIEQQLIDLSNGKALIKQAIEAKGISLSGVPFSGYGAKIASIPSGSSGLSDVWSEAGWQSVLDSANAEVSAWQRPSDWLPLPALTGTEQKFVGLFAIYEDANFLALSAGGAYTVDWGDGTVENIASGSTSQHEYQWSNVPANTLSSQGIGRWS